MQSFNRARENRLRQALTVGMILSKFARTNWKWDETFYKRHKTVHKHICTQCTVCISFGLQFVGIFLEFLLESNHTHTKIDTTKKKTKTENNCFSSKCIENGITVYVQKICFARNESCWHKTWDIKRDNVQVSDFKKNLRANAFWRIQCNIFFFFFGSAVNSFHSIQAIPLKIRFCNPPSDFVCILIQNLRWIIALDGNTQSRKKTSTKKPHWMAQHISMVLCVYLRLNESI